jgi:nucleotide-binding universal stress UspA family protein
VVVGVSGSPGSVHALRFAIERAHELGATLMPVIAWQPPGGDSAMRPYPAHVADGWADAAEARLLTAVNVDLGGVPEDVRTEPHVVRGRPGRVLVAFADRPGDLLVLGEPRPGRLRRAWSGAGSVARHCLAHAACPVVTVNADARPE